MTAQVISFTEHYNARRIPLWQLQLISDTYRSYLREYKHDDEVKSRYRIVTRELNRRKECL